MPRHAIDMNPVHTREPNYNLIRPSIGNIFERRVRKRHGQNARNAAFDMSLRIARINLQVFVQLALTPGDCLVNPSHHAGVPNGHHAERVGKLWMQQHGSGREDFSAVR